MFTELKRTIQVEIENKLQTVVLTIDYHPKSKHHAVSAICETGFDLCGHGSDAVYFKQFVECNTRLRSKKSIEKNMDSILDGYEAAIIKSANEIILTEKEFTGSISGDSLHGIPNLYFTNTCNLKSLQSERSIAWHSHDVYKEGKIDCIIKRGKDGRLQVFANEKDLYDLKKLRKLYKSDSYKNKRFAFFFYEEVARLLGKPYTNPDAMSGLFQ